MRGTILPAVAVTMAALVIAHGAPLSTIEPVHAGGRADAASAPVAPTSNALLASLAEVSGVPHPVPEVAAGFALAVLAPVAAPTAIAWGPGDGDGPDLYATTLTGSVERVSIAWTPGGPVATGASTFAGGLGGALGLAFDGDVLYVATSAANPDTGRTDGRVVRIDGGERTVVVDGLPNGRHNTNHLRFGPDGRLYVANGNPNDNGKDPDADVLPYSGAILSVDVSEVSASPAVLEWFAGGGEPIPPDEIAAHPVNADFAAAVHVLASGFRNVFGVAFSDAGVAYTATNGADSPSSQDLLYRITPGTDYGYPFCFNVGPSGGVGAAVKVENNPLFAEADCSDVPPATANLGWHVCATGLDVPTEATAGFPGAYATSVYVAECGPFQPETDKLGTHDTGHKVVRVGLDANGHAVEVKDFVTGLALPTDVLFGPDGAMYVADAGGIFRVAATPAAGLT